MSVASPLLVDTNVLVDVLENDPDWADWSIAQLQAQSKVHRLALCCFVWDAKA